MDHSTNASVFSAPSPKFTIQKFVGELKVIDSGVLHCESSKPIRFLIDDFELIFNFKALSEKQLLQHFRTISLNPLILNIYLLFQYGALLNFF